jgi:hypothetical protein
VQALWHEAPHVREWDDLLHGFLLHLRARPAPDGKEQPGWRKLANQLGFRDAKIDAPWTFPDEGRLIPYQRIKDGKFLSK